MVPRVAGSARCSAIRLRRAWFPPDAVSSFAAASVAPAAPVQLMAPSSLPGRDPTAGSRFEASPAESLWPLVSIRDGARDGIGEHAGRRPAPEPQAEL